MKIKLSSVLDLSRYLTTPAGQSLKDVLQYLSMLAQEVITALSNNLSYEDNFSCEIKRVVITNNVQTRVLSSKALPVKEIRVRRIYDNNYYVVSSFGWTYDVSGNLSILLNLAGAPAPDRQVSVDLIIYYG